MSKNIVEENPNAPQPSGGAADKVRKQARQLAYDVRYKVKQGFKEGQKTDPASLKRAYMSQLGKSPAPGPVRQLAKKMLIGESYDFIDITETVSNAVADAVKKVFVKTTKLDDAEGNPAYEVVDFMQESSVEKKYKIRVTDKKTGKSYTRYADRDKISELRKNPNISSVEMTGYGTPYEGERTKGKQTAAVKAGKDFDGDGKKESSSKEHAGVVHNAIQRKKGGIPDGKDTRKEEFIGEVKDVESDNPDANVKKVDVMKGKNKITINPNQCEAVDSPVGDKKPDAGMDAKQKRVAIMKRQILQKKMQAVRGGAGADIVAHNELEGEVIKDDAQYGYDKDGKSLNPKDKEKDSEKKVPKNSVVFDGGAAIEPVGDEREIPTIVNLMKTKLRARGLNMSQEPKGKLVEQGIEDILARLEKKRISKGGNPDASPLGKKTGRAMKAKQDAARKKAGVKTEEIELDEAERKLADRLHRKRKLYDRTTKKAMDYARREGEAAGHARYRMGQLDDEMDKVKDKMKKEEVESLDELKTSTLRSYANRASVEAVGRGVDAGIKGMTGPKKEMEKNMTKAYKRQQGINRAVNKLASRAERNEEYDNTKSPDYEKKKKALAKKHGGADKIKGHPQYESIVQSAVDSLDRFSAKKN